VLRALIGQSKKRCVAYTEMLTKFSQGESELAREVAELARSQDSAEEGAGAYAEAAEYLAAIDHAIRMSRMHLEAQAHYELQLQRALEAWLSRGEIRAPAARRAPPPLTQASPAPWHRPLVAEQRPLGRPSPAASFAPAGAFAPSPYAPPALGPYVARAAAAHRAPPRAPAEEGPPPPAFAAAATASPAEMAPPPWAAYAAAQRPALPPKPNGAAPQPEEEPA
jgi:hypothetical protein